MSELSLVRRGGGVLRQDGTVVGSATAQTFRNPSTSYPGYASMYYIKVTTLKFKPDMIVAMTQGGDTKYVTVYLPFAVTGPYGVNGTYNWRCLTLAVQAPSNNTGVTPTPFFVDGTDAYVNETSFLLPIPDNAKGYTFDFHAYKFG